MFSSIKFKVIAIIVACLVAGAFAITYLFNLSYQNNIDMVAKESLKTSIESFNNLSKEKLLQMRGITEWILDNDEYKRQMTIKDRAKMNEWNLPIFKVFKKQYGITNWTNINPNLTGFYRTTEPTFNDPVTRFNVKQSAKNQDWGEGLELGKTGFALRTAYPVYDKAKIGNLKNGNLIGYIELGCTINQFFDIMKVETGNDYGMLIKKEALDHKKWKMSRELAGMPDNWDDQKDLVIGTNTANDESIFKYDGDISTISDSGKVLEIVNKGDKTYIRSVFPVKTAAGKKLAAVFVLRDITPIYSQLQDMQNKAILYIVVLMVVISVIMIAVFNSLIIKRLRNMVDIATRVVGGDYNMQIAATSNDEIGKFESLFEQFRTVFVSLVNELENKNK